MRSLSLLAVLWLTGFLAARQGPDKAEEELKKLQGTWSYLSVDLAGKKLPDDIVSKGTLTIKGNTYTTTLAGQVTDEGILQLDPAKKPKQWDKISNKAKEAKILGVYELEGDTLKYCEGVAGAERPGAVQSKKMSLESASVLKRQSK
jgi:uncharacterized protein (TIGR03067 family)